MVAQHFQQISCSWVLKNSQDPLGQSLTVAKASYEHWDYEAEGQNQQKFKIQEQKRRQLFLKQRRAILINFNSFTRLLLKKVLPTHILSKILL